MTKAAQRALPRASSPSLPRHFIAPARLVPRCAPDPRRGWAWPSRRREPRRLRRLVQWSTRGRLLEGRLGGLVRRHQTYEFTMSREIEPVRRSFCRHGNCTFTEVAHLVPSGLARSPGFPESLEISFRDPLGNYPFVCLWHAAHRAARTHASRRVASHCVASRRVAPQHLVIDAVADTRAPTRTRARDRAHANAQDVFQAAARNL